MTEQDQLEQYNEERRADAYYQEQQEEHEAAQALSAPPGSIPDELLLADGRREICKKALGDFGRLSATIVQRRCLVGYGRAMRILDALHYEGTINRADHRGWHFPSSNSPVRASEE